MERWISVGVATTLISQTHPPGQVKTAFPRAAMLCPHFGGDMSTEGTTWAWKQRGLSGLAKCILVRLADFANQNGECWPSQARIADDTGIPRETVNRLIKRLVEQGFLAIENQITQKGKGANRYFLRCDVGSHPDVTPDHMGCDVGSHRDVTPDHIEPSLEPLLEPTPLNPPKGDRSLKAEFKDWWEGYPHKVGKGAAETKFKVARRIASAAELAEGVRRYVATKPADRPWCNPATWLHQKRWLDQPAMLFPAGVEVSPSRAPPPPPMDPKKLGHSLPCHCANCLRWVEEASHAAA